MVDVQTGNLLNAKVQTLVNTVNCVGVMGKGIALEFREAFPEMYTDYVARCARGDVQLGRPYVFKSLLEPWILNFPTKDHWRSVSRIQDIERGLDYLAQHYREWGITSLAVPPLGCGNGQLDWGVVGPLLFQRFSQFDIPVTLYPPGGTPPEQLDGAFLIEPQGGQFQETGSFIKQLDPAWIALAEILARIQQQPYHGPIGRVMVQKLAYFATDLGIPTGLIFVPGSYGPFASGLKRVQTRLVNNGVLEEQQTGRSFVLRPGRSFHNAARFWSSELAQWNEPIEQVTDLFTRLKSTRQAEIAATVHFVARSLSRQLGHLPSEHEICDEVQRWKRNREPQFEDAEIMEAIHGLTMLGLMDVLASDELLLREDEALYA